MRIAQISYLYEPAIGGVEIVVKKLSEGLVKKGHEVHVFTSDFTSLSCDTRVKEKNVMINGVYVHRFRGWKLPPKHLFAARMIFPGLLFKLLQLRKFDVVHVHSVPSNHFDIAYLYTKIFKIPLVVHGHYSPDDLDIVFESKSIGAFYFKWWIKKFLQKVNKYIAVVGVEKEKIAKLCNIKKSNICIIPNGVSPDEFDQVLEVDIENFRIRHELIDEKLIIFVGRIAKHKGPDLLIDAVCQLFLKKSINNCKILIIGPDDDFEYISDLKIKVELSGFKENFKFMKLKRPDVITAIKAGQVLVLPSRGEVFGIVLAEAMYCKKLVIGTNAGGIPEVLDYGKSGLLFDKDDIDGLAYKLNMAINETDSQLIKNVRASGYERACKFFNWEIIVGKVESVYLELV